LKLSLFHICRPKEGEVVSGDTVVTRESEGAILLAVLDALGHGPPAAAVAEQGREFLLSVSLSLNTRIIMEGLHDALRGSRGAAAMCCLLKEDRIEGCGVGNVEMRSAVSRVPVVLTPGIVGVRYQPLRVFECRLVAGARILMFTDGVSPRMDVEPYQELPAQGACVALMDRYRRPHDDATLLVADIAALGGKGVMS
jgi:phosphoserine phosphatase RsbX